eukprot:4065366-Lingulodinium_polyedra.AAC.1
MQRAFSSVGGSTARGVAVREAGSASVSAAVADVCSMVSSCLWRGRAVVLRCHRLPVLSYPR